jgi:hypothetical protein
VEFAIAALGLLFTVILPQLGGVIASLSAYSVTTNGWFALSPASYAARVVVAVVLLTPITLLMGGTLTMLIRHRVQADVGAAGRRVAALYGVNTAGAAVGAFLTDFALVPVVGLFAGAAWRRGRMRTCRRRRTRRPPPCVPADASGRGTFAGARTTRRLSSATTRTGTGRPRAWCSSASRWPSPASPRSAWRFSGCGISRCSSAASGRCSRCC